MARPRKLVHAEREKTFARAFAQTGSFAKAREIAGMDPTHVIRLMDRADFRSLAAAMLAGDLPAVLTVEVVEPEVERVQAAA